MDSPWPPDERRVAPMAAANAGLVVWATRAEARWRAEGARRRAASWAGAAEAVESERRVEAAGEGTSERTLTRESIAWRRGGEGGAGGGRRAGEGEAKRSGVSSDRLWLGAPALITISLDYDCPIPSREIARSNSRPPHLTPLLPPTTTAAASYQRHGQLYCTSLQPRPAPPHTSPPRHSSAPRAALTPRSVTTTRPLALAPPP